jgi:hypothetical protein
MASRTMLFLTGSIFRIFFREIVTTCYYSSFLFYLKITQYGVKIRKIVKFIWLINLTTLYLCHLNFINKQKYGKK